MRIRVGEPGVFQVWSVCVLGLFGMWEHFFLGRDYEQLMNMVTGIIVVIINFIVLVTEIWYIKEGIVYETVAEVKLEILHSSNSE